MQITRVKCWFVGDSIYDVAQVEAQPHTLDLVKKSILKAGYRAYCLTDRAAIESSAWYQLHLISGVVIFYIEGSGLYKLANIDLVESEFYFEKSNLPARYRPWIFYSWQSDYNPSRGHIREGINSAVDIINSRNPKSQVIAVESTRPEDGAGNIVEAIKANIDRSLMAIFDITNVSRVDANEQAGKCYPNANVVFELGYALSRKRADQVLMIKKSRSAELGNDSTPFDFAQNRRIDYDRPATLKQQISDAVVEYFERIGFLR
ncbi:MAG: nucleotide-binding protein [Cyanobacteria bacterium]|nr:nucleotide-binding protein [Cyanobacteriota bacterium]